MNIFICQTPFQLFYAKILINYLFKEKESFFIIHSDLSLKNDWIDNIEFFNIRQKKGIYNEFIQIKQAVKIINRKVKLNPSQINFYISHIGGLLSNYIFYKKKFINNPNLHINLYYEGVLYFYNYREKFQSFHVKRILTAILLGFNYKVNKAILPYNSKKIKYIYTPFKKFTKGYKDKIIEVLLESNLKEARVNKNYFLILGGPVNYLKSFYKKSVEEILKLKTEDPKIFYKGHSSFNTHNIKYKDFFYQVIDNYDLEYEELDANVPVEILLDEVEPLKIYSYYSSSLLNIKSMSRNAYEIVCFFDNNQPEEYLQEIFEYYNISIIKIN